MARVAVYRLLGVSNDHWFFALEADSIDATETRWHVAVAQCMQSECVYETGKKAIDMLVAQVRKDLTVASVVAGARTREVTAAEIEQSRVREQCKDIEFMGIFATDPVLGIRGQFAKVRNHSQVARIVTVAFVDALEASKRATSEVGAGAIASIRLAVSDRGVSDVRLVSCR